MKNVKRAETVYRLAVKIFRERYRFRDRHLRVVACPWATLLKKVIEAGELESTESRRGLVHILEDIEAILGFYGFRNTRWVNDLVSPDVMSLRLIDVDQRSSRALTSGAQAGRRERKAAALHGSWWEGTSGVRGIDPRSLSIMGGEHGR